MKLEICKMLTLSTAHITKETAMQLDNEATSAFKSIYGLPVYKKHIYGWFIYLNEIDPQDWEENIPMDLKQCIITALAAECTVLCLDCDGPEVDLLEKYNW